MENRFTNSNFKKVFGELESIHRVRRSKLQTIVIPTIFLLFLFFAVIAYGETQDIWILPICMLPSLLMLCGIIWHLFSTQNDELKIYKNGFTYKNGKNLQSCLWKEMKTYHYRERNSSEIAEFESDGFPLGSIEKKNGEIIEFNHDLPGTHTISKKVLF